MSDELTADYTDEAAPKRRHRTPATKAAPEQPERVWITLDENKNISPRGQFFGINGMSYILRPGKKAYVPRGIVDILDNATQMDPVVNPDTLQIDSWVERPRFSYRLHPNG